MTAEDVVEARRMRAKFRTWSEIAKHFGVTLPTLRSAMRREGAAS